ncbi:MAG: c-type cytochrome [Kofleriaceae bacterium]
MTFECARCHDIPGIELAPERKHCVRCHQAIHAGTFAAKQEHLDRWKKRITSMRWAPSLAGADRLRRSWVQAFLLAPHDVRPGLIAQMPRLAITPEQAARIAAHLVPAEAPEPAARADGAMQVDGVARTDPSIARGAELFRALACGRCHRFTGSSVDDVALHAKGRTVGSSVDLHTKGRADPLDAAWALAPDLRFARQRMTEASMAAWIEHPRGAMPSLGVSAESARMLAAFIAGAPLDTSAMSADARTMPARLPILARAVTYDEVDRRVFKNVCWHCHAVPDFARGDGGPGNSGGFGFAPRGLDVSSYEGLASGALDDSGERRSIFAKLPDGTPRVVAHLMARYVEEAGGSVDGVRGMPLGLPPLPLEEIQLVESWIAQGRPR